MEFKYQTLFTCNVPAGFSAIQSFNELVATDEPQTPETISATISLSFDKAGLKVSKIELSDDMTYCDVFLKSRKTQLRVLIRSRPSIVHDGVIYKLEELYL